MAKQIKAFNNAMVRRGDSPSINVQAEFDLLQIRVEELNKELSQKDLIITFLRKDRETLIDENERLEVELEKNLTTLRERRKRKIYML